MPVNRHLAWTEIADFTPGLFEGERFLMPYNAAQEMTDCVPLPQGGLRAFHRPITFTDTGGLGADVVAMGIASRSVTVSGTTGPDRYVIAYDTNSGQYRIYRMNEANSESSWSLEKSHASGSPASALPMSSDTRWFQDSSGNYYLLYGIRDETADAGLWAAQYATATATYSNPDGNSYTGPIAVYQARIAVGNGSGSNGERLHYGDEGILDTAAGSLDIVPHSGFNTLELLEPFEPDDLLIGTAGAGWRQVSGDLSSSSVTVRALGDAYDPRVIQKGIYVPGGIVFVESTGDAYVTDGRNFDPISPQLDGWGHITDSTADSLETNGPGQGAFLNGFIFMPNNYVLDWRTKAWFKVGLTDTMGYWHDDRYRGEIWAMEKGKNPRGYRYYPFDDNDNNDKRIDDYTWKSAPLADPGGRRVEIREVQVFYDAHASSRFDVTVNGTTRQVTGLSSGFGKASFLFDKHGEYLDVKVRARATSSANEAPTIERIRIGTRQPVIHRTDV